MGQSGAVSSLSDIQHSTYTKNPFLWKIPAQSWTAAKPVELSYPINKTVIFKQKQKKIESAKVLSGDQPTVGGCLSSAGGPESHNSLTT